MTEDTFIHSDQGTHVLTLPFKKSKLQEGCAIFVQTRKLRDNAPQDRS
jgi:hypothetical protein